MEALEIIGGRAKEAAAKLNLLGQEEKAAALRAAAEARRREADVLLEANEGDVARAQEKGIKDSLIDRLRLTKDRIDSMASGLEEVAMLEDPIGEIISMKKRPNGLMIGQKRVPLGVVGIIYESRPNVTADAFGLCFKTGNAAILRGGSDAIGSNLAITRVLQESLKKSGLPEYAVQLISDTGRDTAARFMKLNQYVDVLIPRGGAGLIQTVVENSTIPVIETGTGNCHIYVDESADYEMALNIIDNAKTQRLGVCNACESLVVHSAIIREFLPLLYERLTAKQIVFRADERAREVVPAMEAATEEDYGKEYLDRLISLKIVDTLDEAIAHINRYNTGHSEAIVTQNYENAMRLYPQYAGSVFFYYLENDRKRFRAYIRGEFWKDMAMFIKETHYNGDDLFRGMTEDV